MREEMERLRKMMAELLNLGTEMGNIYTGRSNAGQPGQHNGFTLVFNKQQFFHNKITNHFEPMNQEAANTIDPIDVFSPKGMK